MQVELETEDEVRFVVYGLRAQAKGLRTEARGRKYAGERFAAVREQARLAAGRMEALADRVEAQTGVKAGR